MSIFQPILEAATFLLSVLISFYLPGKLVTNKLSLKLNFLESLFFNISLGIVVFTLVSYLLDWIKLSILILPTLLVISYLTLKKGFNVKKFDKKDKPYLFLILIITILFSLPVITSGQFGDSFRFVGANYADGLWHVSLINELKYHFPPGNPGFTGVPLVGYHFFFNYVAAKLSSIFNTPSLSLYFHFFPVLIAFLWALGVFVLLLKWTGSRSAALWAVFLTIFGGSFAFILRLQGHPGSLDDAFGMTQPFSSLLNPPFAISIVLIIAVLFSLLEYLKTKKNAWLVPIILISGTITMFKVYAGIIVLGSLSLMVLVQLFKKNYLFFLAFLGSILLFFSTYWVFHDPSSRLFFFPFWAPHKVLTDNLPWYGFGESQYTFYRLHVLRGIFRIESDALDYFLFGSLGTRSIGILFLIILYIKRLKFSQFSSFILFMTLISIGIPLFFIQSGKVFEIVQMTWYFLFFCALFAAIGFSKIFDLNFNRVIKISLIISIVLFTLPSAYEKIDGYLFTIKPNILSQNYLKATKYLKSQGNYDSIVLEIPPSEIGYLKDGMSWWYNSRSSSKLIALSEKRGFLNNEGIVFKGTDSNERIPLVIDIMRYEMSPENNTSALLPGIEQEIKKNKIVYIFSPFELLRLEKTSIKKIFKNKEAVIYKVSIQ